jgi:hypothetical protein
MINDCTVSAPSIPEVECSCVAKVARGGVIDRKMLC